jgi:ribosomal protein L31
VTDALVPFPCLPWQIQGNNVDVVVEVDSIGDPTKIVSGTTQLTQSPDRRRIAELAARFCAEAGIMRNGFSFQAGAGGTTLAFALYLRDLMRSAGVTARFARGGSTEHMVEMLEEGLVEYILDGQTFDLHGVRSMRDNPRHVDTSPFTSYNFHGKGNFASLVDVAVLGATEVDLEFNGNVVTHSDGRLLHGIGGWQNCLSAGCSMLLVPSFRDRIPVIVDRVTTLCGPGDLIDVVVTERGIAVNPRRQDLLDAVTGSSLPIRPIADLQPSSTDLACRLAGASEEPVAVAGGSTARSSTRCGRYRRSDQHCRFTRLKNEPSAAKRLPRASRSALAVFEFHLQICNWRGGGTCHATPEAYTPPSRSAAGAERRSEMKPEIHPEYKEVEVRCACGNTFMTRSTKSELRLEICSVCHPFYTCKQKLIDTAGMVEKFERRYSTKGK